MCSARLKFRPNSMHTIGSALSFVLFRWHQRVHLYVYLIVLSLACLISYQQPFGLLFNWTHIVPETLATASVRNALISKQKQDQRQAYEWLDQVAKNAHDYPQLISNETGQSRFYDFLQTKPSNSLPSLYHLFQQPRHTPPNHHAETNDRIIISILYSQQDTSHREGKFYVGQVLHRLLQRHHSRFIITLCENNNTHEKVSDEIDLIRRLVPVFLVDTVASDGVFNIYEQEKQAHLQCILANFQSFANVKYLLLLQDDTEPAHEDFYDRFVALIDDRIKHQWPEDGHRQQPAFVKIYHPRWLIDYLHPSVYIIVQLIATSLFLASLLLAGLHCFHKTTDREQKYQRTDTHGKSPSTSIRLNPACVRYAAHRHLLYFIVYFPLITLVLVLLNHSNVSWSWRSLHPSFYAIYPAPSCCLPGVIYFRQTYLQVIDYLNSVKCVTGYAIDTAFDDLPRRTPLRTYLIEPNLVHHIGLYSRLRHTYINPYLLD